MKSLKNSKSNKLHSKKLRRLIKIKRGGVNPFSFIGTKASKLGTRIGNKVAIIKRGSQIESKVSRDLYNLRGVMKNFEQKLPAYRSHFKGVQKGMTLDQKIIEEAARKYPRATKEELTQIVYKARQKHPHTHTFVEYPETAYQYNISSEYNILKKEQQLAKANPNEYHQLMTKKKELFQAERAHDAELIVKAEKTRDVRRAKERALAEAKKNETLFNELVQNGHQQNRFEFWFKSNPSYMKTLNKNELIRKEAIETWRTKLTPEEEKEIFNNYFKHVKQLRKKQAENEAYKAAEVSRRKHLTGSFF